MALRVLAGRLLAERILAARLLAGRFLVGCLVAGCLAACWTQQLTKVAPTTPPPEARPEAWRRGAPRVAASEPCASAAPFSVQATNKTKMATKLCRAFERAWEDHAERAPTRSSIRAVEFELREASVREATGLTQCDLTLTVRTPRGPAAQGVARAESADDCAYEVLVSLLYNVVDHMQKSP